MLRVLQEVNYMARGGLETMLMNYYRHIDRKKLQFDFLVHGRERKDYDDEIEALGGKIYRLPELNPFNIGFRKALHEFFGKHSEYEIVHSHHDCLSSIVLKEAKKNGIPIRIAHSHNTSQAKNLTYPIKMFYRKYIPRYATHLLACGEQAGIWMFEGRPFQVLKNAIDAKTYMYNKEKRELVRKQLDVSETTVLIGHVGNFTPVKNHEFLFNVFADIQKRCPSKLLLVGDGPLQSDLKKKAIEMEIVDNVVFAGVRSDVADLLQAMDVFVFPSKFEGIPVALIEAQAAGLPCLISDRVSSEAKMTDLAQQISLAESSELWAERAITASQTERINTIEYIRAAGYDIQKNAEKLQEFYFKLAAGEKNASLQYRT